MLTPGIRQAGATYGCHKITPNSTPRKRKLKCLFTSCDEYVLMPNSAICMDITTILYKTPDENVAATTSKDASMGMPISFDFFPIVYVLTATPFPATYNPCSPLLSVPSKILAMNSDWSTCYTGTMDFVHDPNSVIQTANGFSPIARTSTNSPTIATASVGASVTQNIAIQTVTTVITYPTARPTDDPLPPPISNLPATVMLWNTVLTPDSDSAIAIGSHTVKPGEQMIVSGTTISYASDERELDVDGTIQHMAPAYAVGTKTISVGGPAETVSGKTYSLAAGGSSIVIDGTTQAANSATQASKPTNGIQKIWVPGYVVNGQALIAGGLPITTSGTVLSLEPGAESVMIGGSKMEDISDWLGSSNSTESRVKALSDSSSSVSQSTVSTMGSLSVVPPSIMPVSTDKKEKSGAPREVESGVWIFLGALQLIILAGVYL
jgi:hypothetical protein